MGRGSVIARWLLAIGLLLFALPPLFRWSRVPQASAQAVEEVTAPTGTATVPGLGKLTVKARFADGARPEGAQCLILGRNRWRAQDEAWPWGAPTPGVTGKPEAPSVKGADGDWVIHDLCNGSWLVQVAGEGFAMGRADGYTVYVKRGNEGVGASWAEYTCVVGPGGEGDLAVELLRFGTVRGEVLSAENGRPVGKARVSIHSENGAHCSAQTDALGRYEATHVPAGRATIAASAEDFVTAYKSGVLLQERQERTVDFALARGGYISGRVALPPGGWEWRKLNGVLRASYEGQLPHGLGIPWHVMGEGGSLDGTFRVGPLATGTYRLELSLHPTKGAGGDGREWQGEVHGLAVEVGKETGDVVVEVEEVKRRR